MSVQGYFRPIGIAVVPRTADIATGSIAFAFVRAGRQLPLPASICDSSAAVGQQSTLSPFFF
jgi:hypothetical protein